MTQNFGGNLYRCTGYRPGRSCCGKHAAVPFAVGHSRPFSRPLHFPGNFNITHEDDEEQCVRWKHRALTGSEGFEGTKIDNIKPQVSLRLPRGSPCDRVGLRSIADLGLRHKPIVLRDVVFIYVLGTGGAEFDDHQGLQEHYLPSSCRKSSMRKWQNHACTPCGAHCPYSGTSRCNRCQGGSPFKVGHYHY